MPSTETTALPPSASSRTFRESLLAMLGLCFVIMMVALDQTVVGTALPTIVAELHGFDLYAWVATAYLLTSVITVPIFGRLGDLYGRKFFVIASIVIFTLASMLCGLASSMLYLVLARGLQGIGGGMLIGTSFACIPDLFPEPHVRMRWQVMFSAAFGVANAIGPSLGGFLTQYYGWRSVFFVNLPVGLLCLWFIGRHMPHIRHGRPAGPVKLDWPGALLIAAALGCLQLLVELLPRHGLHGVMPLLALAAIAAFVGLYWHEKHCDHAVLPFEMFRDRTQAALFVLSLLTGFMMFSLLFYIPLLLQGGFDMTPNTAGLFITPLVVCITVGSITNGRLITRIPNPTVMLPIGYVLLGLCGYGIATLRIATPHWLMIGYMLGCGVGLGFIIPNLTVFTQETAGRAHLGIATAMIQSMRMVGGMLGTALVGTFVQHAYVRGVRDALAERGALRWTDPLIDPQILVNHDARVQFIQRLHAIGQNALPLLDSARVALVTAIHDGQLLTAVMALVALWQTRRLPVIQLKRRNGPASSPAGE